MTLPWPDWSEQEWREAEPKALGGPGSGNFGHAGRPGQVGGSASSPATPYQFHHSLVTSGFRSPTSAADRARVRALRVPPAWTDVQLNPDPEGKLQATGRDVKGRLQYRYSTEHTGEANAEKFERVKEFSQKVPGLRTQIDTDLESDDPEVQEAATVLYLIDKTGFRIGTARDTMAEKKAYGASTLESRHIKIDGDKVTFRFTAKKGVQINKTVTDARLARALKIQMSETNKRAPLFDLTNEAGVRQYMAKHAPGFTPKDFRTHFATAAALRAMKGIPFPKTEKAFTLARRKVAKSVSHALGNTPAVALKSYIDPSVFAQWQENTRLRAAAAQSDDALIQEYVETTSYDVPGDWRKRSEDPDE